MKRPASIKVLEIIGLIVILTAITISVYDYTQYVIPCNPGGEKYNAPNTICAGNGLAILFFGAPLSVIGILLIITCELVYLFKFKKLQQP